MIVESNIFESNTENCLRNDGRDINEVQSLTMKFILKSPSKNILYLETSLLKMICSVYLF